MNVSNIKKISYGQVMATVPDTLWGGTRKVVFQKNGDRVQIARADNGHAQPEGFDNIGNPIWRDCPNPPAAIVAALAK
jgi:hypothetical protein